MEPAPADSADYGRIGYGRFGRYTPLGLAALLIVTLLAIGIINNRAGDDPPDAQEIAAADLANLIGQPAPPIVLTTFSGEQIALESLRGSTVVLNFWATWCVPCREEMPLLQTFANEAQAAGTPIQVLGIGLKARDSDEAARQFVTDLGITYPTGRDTAGGDPQRGPIETTLGLPPYLPITLVIAPDGMIAAAHLGELDADGIRDLVTSAA